MRTMTLTRRKSPRRRAYATLAALLIVSSLLFAADVDGQAAPAPACPPAVQSGSPASAAPGASSPTGLPAPLPATIVACVGSRAITGATFEHWLGVAQKSEPTPKNKAAGATEDVKEVMDFLISGYWVLGQAEVLHIHLSTAAVRKSFERIRAQEFPKHGEFGRFLERSGETPADLMLRVRLNLLSERIQKRVLAGHHGAHSRTLALQRFLKRFSTEWPAKTYCEPAYAVKDCGHVQSPL
jgi:hypothetical protein